MPLWFLVLLHCHYWREHLICYKFTKKEQQIHLLTTVPLTKNEKIDTFNTPFNTSKTISDRFLFRKAICNFGTPPFCLLNRSLISDRTADCAFPPNGSRRGEWSVADRRTKYKARQGLTTTTTTMSTRTRLRGRNAGPPWLKCSLCVLLALSFALSAYGAF